MEKPTERRESSSEKGDSRRGSGNDAGGNDSATRSERQQVRDGDHGSAREASRRTGDGTSLAPSVSGGADSKGGGGDGGGARMPGEKLNPDGRWEMTDELDASRSSTAEWQQKLEALAKKRR